MNINVAVFLCETLVIFSLLVLVYKVFKKDGLIMWMAIAPILANLAVCKVIEICGLETTTGQVLFASIFLCGNILAEKYGKEVSEKAVNLGIISNIIFIIACRFILMYIPSDIDTMHSVLTSVFNFDFRVTLSSIFCLFLSNILNVVVYCKIKEKTKGRLLWLRTNVASILGNCGENFIFTFLAFAGILSLSDIFMIALLGCVFECILANLSTPFIYIAKKIKE